MSQSVSVLDDLTEFAIQFLLAKQEAVSRLPYAMVKRSPNRPPLELVYALSMAAGGIQQMLQGADLSPRAAQAWQMAALLGVDLYMMQRLGLPTDSAGDLLAYWQVHDRFFLP